MNNLFCKSKIIMKIVDKATIFNYSDLVSDTILLKEKKALYHKYAQRLNRSLIIYYTKKIEITLRIIFNIDDHKKLTIIDIYKLTLNIFNDNNYLKKLQVLEKNYYNRFQLRRKIHNILIKEINYNLFVNKFTKKKNLSKIKLLKTLYDYLNFKKLKKII